MRARLITIVTVGFLFAGCTTGQLYSIDSQNNRQLICDVEFVGLPKVDKYAVEYALSLCAKSAARRGLRIDKPELLEIETTIPEAPCGTKWSHEAAKQQFALKKLSNKEYGYIVANIDLGLTTINQCENITLN